MCTTPRNGFTHSNAHTGCEGLGRSLDTSLLPPSLTHLDLGGVGDAIDDQACGGLVGLEQLRSLSLWGCGVTLRGVQVLGFLPSLQQLDVSWTQVDAVPLLPHLTVRHACSYMQHNTTQHNTRLHNTTQLNTTPATLRTMWHPSRTLYALHGA